MFGTCSFLGFLPLFILHVLESLKERGGKKLGPFIMVRRGECLYAAVKGNTIFHKTFWYAAA